MTLNPHVRGYRFGECRLLGHLWHVVPSDWEPHRGVAMTTRCERCDIERRDCVEPNTGEVEARRYAYPEGYLFSRDTDTDVLPARRDFRLAWLDDAIMRTRRASRSRARKAAS